MRWTTDILRPLVEEWDERVRIDVPRTEKLVPEVIAAGSVLRPPATEQEIADAETRLGVILPPSYRAFLRLSNGAYASSLGAEKDVGTGHKLRWGFLQVAELRPLSDVDPQQIEIWTDVAIVGTPEQRGVPVFAEAGKASEVRDWELLRTALVISRPWDLFVDLLVPRGSEEWEVWTTAKEGALAHASFAELLIDRISRADRRPNPALADLYVAEVRDGRFNRLNDLVEIEDPRAGDLALEVLDHPKEAFRRSAVKPLRDLGEERFLPRLRQEYESATWPDHRINLLAALQTCGAPEIDELLAEAARDGDDQVRAWASRWLGA